MRVAVIVEVLRHDGQEIAASQYPELVQFAESAVVEGFQMLGTADDYSVAVVDGASRPAEDGQ